MRGQLRLCVVVLLLATGAVGVAGATPRAEVREGGIFRVSSQGIDFIDPALSYSVTSWALLDTTCARLMTYPDKPPPEGFRLVPEVAVDFPKVSRDAKTHTFTLRSGFRFSDGTPVRASAFARAINRTLAPGITSPALQYTQDIAGAADVRAGKTRSAAGVIVQGSRLIVRFTRPIPDFAARTTMPFFCAVPPTLPADPEGVGAFPGAGPYYVSEYRPGERVVLRRNRFYGGDRPHHVDGFEADLRATTPQDVLDRVERGEADWGFALASVHFEPGRQLDAKYGVNRSQFFVRPGLLLQLLAFNTRRPLFGSPRLRRAANFALDRRAWARARDPSGLSRRLTDQYLPHGIPGFQDANIYPLEQADLSRARELARGNTRDGKAVLYAMDAPTALAGSQVAKQQLQAIGLDVEVVAIPAQSFAGRLLAEGERWDMAFFLWGPDYLDPYAYINRLLDGRSVTNWSGFNSPAYNRLMRQAGRLRGQERYHAYAKLDVQLARDAAPLAALSIFNEPTLVSKRVGCIVLRPRLDLTAVCLK